MPTIFDHPRPPRLLTVWAIGVVFLFGLTALEARAQAACRESYRTVLALKRADAWNRLSAADSLARMAQEARLCYEQAASWPEGQAILLEIETYALNRSNQYRTSKERVDLFFERYTDVAPPRMLAEMWMRKGFLDHVFGDVGAMRYDYVQAALYADLLDVDESLDLKSTIAQTLQEAGQFDQAEKLFLAVIDEIPPSLAGDQPFLRVRAQALFMLAEGTLGRCQTHQGTCSIIEGIDAAAKAVRLFELTGPYSRALQARLQHAILLRWHGRLGHALNLLDQVSLAALERDNIRMHDEALHLKTAFKEAAGLPVQQTPWTIQPVRDALTFSTTVALLLLVGYVRRRRKSRTRHSQADTAPLIDIPDYLDEHRKIKVPASKLQDDDRPFYAVRLGPITLIAKIYWRIVHY